MSSELNPADYASRGCTANKLIDSPIWFDGPGFLSKAPEDWPNTLYQPPLTESAYAEFDLPKVKVMTTVVKASDEAASTDRQISHFSSLNKLLLATAWILRFKQYLQSRAKGSNSSISNHSISTTELEQAEIALVKYVQLSRMGFEVKWKEESGKTAQIAQFTVAQPSLDYRGDESRGQAS